MGVKEAFLSLVGNIPLGRGKHRSKWWKYLLGE